MRCVCLIALLAGSPGILRAAPWLQSDDGRPWPSRVALSTTGVGPVQEDIRALSARSFALLATRPTLSSPQRMPTDPPGFPVPFETQDLDGDGTADELLFVSEYRGDYLLYFSSTEGPTELDTASIVLSDAQAGSWSALQAAAGPSRGVDRAQLTQRVLADLTTESPMTVLSLPGVEVWLGKHSGLIERVAFHGDMWHGSSFREWATNLPNLPSSGELRLTDQGPVRVCLRHSGPCFRDIEVWADGTVFTTGDGNWESPVLVARAVPYEFSDGTERPLRFSEVIGAGRSPADERHFTLSAPDGDGLRCTVTGGRLVNQWVHMDTGALARAAASHLRGDQGAADATWQATLGRLFRAVVCGAAWAYRLQPQPTGTLRLDYRFGASVLGSGPHVGMHRAPLQQPQQVAEQPGQPIVPLQGEPRISVRALSPRVPRLHPNTGYGWELKPFIRAIDNPLPACFEVTVRNDLAEATRIVVDVESAQWLEKVELLSNYETWQDEDGIDREGYAWRETIKSTQGQHSVELNLPGLATGRFLLALYAGEHAVGKLSAPARIVAFRAAVTRALEFEVVPNIPIIAAQRDSALPPRLLHALGINTITRPGLLAADVPGRWVSPDGALTAAGLHRAKRTETASRWRLDGFFAQQALGLERLMSAGDGPAVGPVLTQVRAMGPAAREAFLAGFANAYRPWERWLTAYEGLDAVVALRRGARPSDAAAMYGGFKAAAARPMVHTFSLKALPAMSPTNIPCDVPMMRCGPTDADVHAAGNELATPHKRLFARWLSDPAFSLRVPVGHRPRPQYCTALSAQAAQPSYRGMRRQAWWVWSRDMARGGLQWAGIAPSSLADISDGGQFMVVPTGGTASFILTDRAVALMDISRDMLLLTQLEMAKSRVLDLNTPDARDALRAIKQLEQAAVQASQRDGFEQARALIDSAQKAAADLGPGHASP